jgi:hypothetical protein
MVFFARRSHGIAAAALLWSALTVLASVSILWVMFVFHPVGFGANY